MRKAIGKVCTRFPCMHSSAVLKYKQADLSVPHARHSLKIRPEQTAVAWAWLHLSGMTYSVGVCTFEAIPIPLHVACRWYQTGLIRAFLLP